MSKLVILKIVGLLVMANSALSQPDSILKTNETDFSYHKTITLRYQDSKKVKKVTEIIEAENINTVMFRHNDTVTLFNDHFNSFNLSIKDIHKITLKTGNVSLAAGIIPGIFVGGLIGFAVGGLLYNPDPGASSLEEGFNKFNKKLGVYILGTLIGATVGGIIGAVIINLINHETLDLTKVHEKDKKNKLIRFLKQK